MKFFFILHESRLDVFSVVYLSLKVVVLFDGFRFDDTHSSSDISVFDSSGQESHLVTGVGLLQDLVKHLNTSNFAFSGLLK